ncbi:nucleotidyltransferase domain-containing protein [Microbulbifer sp. TYP-18]|uniref:nucleotidyltransferase domain-containing protein n=1 Tax=Microbulbifer sp. TYP-18 TaxID=3230024 RepID=UPI0034C60AF3
MSVPRFIQKVAGRIRERTDPDLIVLFGSYAKGEANIRSDVDLLILGRFPSQGRREDELTGIAYGFPVGFDFHCVTEKEIARDLRDPGTFYHSVFSAGIVLFCKSGLTFPIN